MPIISLYLLSFDDIEFKMVGVILAIVQLSQFVLEIPSGFISDRIGHKNTLVIARVLFLLSSICFLIGGLTLFVVGAFCFGVGLSFVSGTLTAFMQETLQGLGKMHEYAKIIGKAQSVYLVISAILLMVIPATFAFSIKAPFFIALIFDIIGLFVTLTFVSPPTNKDAQEVGTTNFFSIFKEAKERNMIPITIFISLLFGLILGTRAFQDAYQAFVGVNIVYLGALFASSKILSAFIMRTQLHKLKDKLSFRKFATLVSAVLLLIILTLGLSNNVFVIASAFILSTGLLWGVAPIFTHYKLDLIGNSQNKAGLLSLGGLTDSIIFAGTSFGIGLLVSLAGFQIGYLYYALISIFLMSLAIVFVKYNRPV